MIGNDVYGFYKPAVITTTGTTVAHADGLPAALVLDRAEEIRFYGKRVNGAFTILPGSFEFGGDGATLLVEFSEDDAGSLPFEVHHFPFRLASRASAGVLQFRHLRGRLLINRTNRFMSACVT
jgi:hypothetical protein